MFISLLKGCLSGLIPFVTDLNRIGFLSTDFKQIGFVFDVGFKRTVLYFAVGVKRTGSFATDFKRIGSPSSSASPFSGLVYLLEISSLPDSQAAFKSTAVLCTDSDL